MRTVTLDLSCMTSRAAAHLYLQKTLELPSYYGRNLDALYDCLTEMDDCTILLKNTWGLDALGGYGQLLFRVLSDAAEDNPRLLILFSDSAD